MTTTTAFTRPAEAGFVVGQRVAIHPANNSWLMGERFGEVIRLGRRWVYVKLDLSRREIPFYPGDLEVVS